MDVSQAAIIADNKILQLIKKETAKINVLKLEKMSAQETVSHFLTAPNVDTELA